jgi:nicotinamide-nucleotide amidase
MIIRMVLTGHELLDGRTADVNAAHLGAELRQRGARLASVEIVPDGEDGIRAAVLRAAADADVVVVSGGMGPTDDDNTRQAIAAAAGVALVTPEHARQRLLAKYAARNRAPTEASFRQAIFPDGAELLESDVGTADCFACRVGAARVVALPGVPSEFRGLVARYVLPSIRGTLVRRKFVCFGTGEAELAARVDPIARPEAIELSWRIDRATIIVEVAGERSDAVDGYAELVLAALGDFVVVEADRSIAAALVERCATLGLGLVTAESCTGGAIASAITDVPGASRVFTRGLVVYANTAKSELLGVRRTTLDDYGAVSHQTAGEMLDGLLDGRDSEIGIAVTGIAGPTSDGSAKPVGLVFVAAGSRERRVTLEANVAGRTRAQFKEYVTTLALVAALRIIDDRVAALRRIATVRDLLHGA